MLLLRVEIEVRARGIALPPAEAASGDVLLESPIINERIAGVSGRGSSVRPDSLAPNVSGFLEFLLRQQHIGEHESPLPVRVGISYDQTIPDLDCGRGILF